MDLKPLTSSDSLMSSGPAALGKDDACFKIRDNYNDKMLKNLVYEQLMSDEYYPSMGPLTPESEPSSPLPSQDNSSATSCTMTESAVSLDNFPLFRTTWGRFGQSRKIIDFVRPAAEAPTEAAAPKEVPPEKGTTRVVRDISDTDRCGGGGGGGVGLGELLSTPPLTQPPLHPRQSAGTPNFEKQIQTLEWCQSGPVNKTESSIEANMNSFCNFNSPLTTSVPLKKQSQAFSGASPQLLQQASKRSHCRTPKRVSTDSLIDEFMCWDNYEVDEDCKHQWSTMTPAPASTLSTLDSFDSLLIELIQFTSHLEQGYDSSWTNTDMNCSPNATKLDALSNASATTATYNNSSPRPLNNSRYSYELFMMQKPPLIRTCDTSLCTPFFENHNENDINITPETIDPTALGGILSDIADEGGSSTYEKPSQRTNRGPRRRRGRQGAVSKPSKRSKNATTPLSVFMDIPEVSGSEVAAPKIIATKRNTGKMPVKAAHFSDESSGETFKHYKSVRPPVTFVNEGLSLLPSQGLPEGFIDDSRVAPCEVDMSAQLFFIPQTAQNEQNTLERAQNRYYFSPEL